MSRVYYEIPCASCALPLPVWNRNKPPLMCMPCTRQASARPLAERFWEKVDKNGPIMPGMTTRCELWTGARDLNLYGVIFAGKTAIVAPAKLVKAHVASFYLAEGRWPDPQANHICDHPPCVRRDHLFEGDQFDNMRDCRAKGRHFEANKTHCPQGHPYSGDNLRTYKVGGRQCRECSRRRSREWRLAHRD
jgi:hypothetical protein